MLIFTHEPLLSRLSSFSHCTCEEFDLALRYNMDFPDLYICSIENDRSVSLVEGRLVNRQNVRRLPVPISRVSDVKSIDPNV